MTVQGRPIYPYHPWQVVEEYFTPENNLRSETVFTVGNGYIGMRGTFEEGYDGPPGTSVNGTYLNGFYESEPIVYGEDAYGYARYTQTMLNVTDSKIIKLYIDGEPFSMFSGKILDYKRVLDFKEGMLTRHVVWESPTGKQVDIEMKRFAALSRKHLAVFSYRVTPLNFNGTIKLVSAINGKVQNQSGNTGDPRIGSISGGQVLMTIGKEQASTFGALRQQTKHTKFILVCAMDHEMKTSSPYRVKPEEQDEWLQVTFEIEASQDQPITLTKYAAYVSSRDYQPEELLTIAKETLAEAKRLGFAKLAEEQAQFLAEFWYRSDVEIEGDVALQQSLRFSAFHLLQSVGRDGRTNIAAKGLTGEGYGGHYFWDTETYIFPFFLYTNPDISRKLIEYRYSILDKARERAKELAHKGALYAWRTINGEETSAYYPAGTAQYHINADIIYALKKYINATDDIDFLVTKGAEMLFETARLWYDVGDFIPRKGNKFCINNVTGPDEYTAIVNNNLYTNIMAKDHLEFAYSTAKLMQKDYPQAFAAIKEKIGLEEHEIENWKYAADEMYLPYDEELGIHPQDDSFLDKAVWDFENTPPDKYPLLLHYHPLVIYRYQVLKQADVVLATFLQGNRFTTADKKRNYDYYEPITTHDSSLSPCIYSIMASELGYKDKAYQYFMRTARMDLDDINGNVKDGVHTAAMAGTWLAIFHGFAGVRDYDGLLTFKPTIPENWNSYKFKVTFKNRLIAVNITKTDVEYVLLEGDAITIRHYYTDLHLTPGTPVQVSITPRLEAVIFDLDGVITDTVEYHYLAWKQIADELNIPFDRKYNENLRGISRMESLELILKRGDQQYSLDEKLKLAEKKNEYYQQLINKMTPADLLPGIGSLLQELKAKGIKIGLASASRNARNVLDKLQIADYFDYIVDPTTLVKGKPDPEIFLVCAEAMKVPVQNCVGVEDAEAGIAAIKAANMKAVGVGRSEALRDADIVVQDTNQLTVELLTSLFPG